MNKKDKNKVIIYQAPSGAIELRKDIVKETIWATQAEMASIFGVNPQAITKHLKNIYKEKELFKNSTCSKMEQVKIEGKRKIKRTLEFYNLDVIISVGYRINSTMGTRFRQWATKTLRAHITKGYTINRKRIAGNYGSFLKAVEDVRSFLPPKMKADTGSILELIKIFANTWFSLDAYDKEKFIAGKVSKKKIVLVADDLVDGILKLKTELQKKGEATDIFAIEKNKGAVEGIVGNVMQSFGGKDVYQGVEEKAAHILYFMVKNHPFTDGNKRSGAFAFVWFLSKANILDPRSLTPEALTALTLLVAESDPKDKDRMIGLIILLLGKSKK